MVFEPRSRPSGRANYAAGFQLGQTGKTAFTAEDYYQFHLFEEVKRIGKEALADDYFRHFRETNLQQKTKSLFMV